MIILIEEMKPSLKFNNPKRQQLKIDSYKPTLGIKSTEKTKQNFPVKIQVQRKKSNILPQEILEKENKLPKIFSIQSKESKQSSPQINDRKASTWNRMSLMERPSSSKGASSRSKSHFYRKKTHFINDSSTREDQDYKLEGICDAMLDKLHHNLTLILKSGQVTIKKDLFVKIIQTMVKYIVGETDSIKNEQIFGLIPMFAKIKKILDKINTKIKSKRLTISEKTVVQTFTPQEYQLQCEKQQKKLTRLIKGKKMTLEDIQKLEANKQYQIGICQQKKQQCLQWEKKTYDQKANYDDLCQKYEQLNREYENMVKYKIKLEEDLQMLAEKGNEVFMFVERQKEREFLNNVSKKYKYSQNLLLCYAYEMDKRADMSSYDWEPQPFTAVFNNLKADQKRLLRSLDDLDIPLDKKIQEMKYFVKCTISRFSAKDREMDKVFKRKTDAIKEYVEIVRVWSDQHQMKNQYLGTMRKEYGFDSEQVEKMVKLFEESELNEDQKSWIVTLRKYWNWVNLAFLYGNSFY